MDIVLHACELQNAWEYNLNVIVETYSKYKCLQRICKYPPPQIFRKLFHVISGQQADSWHFMIIECLQWCY